MRLLKIGFVVLLHLTVQSAWAVTVSDVPNPRPSAWVTDLADVIPAELEGQLNTLIDRAHQELTVEIAVVTVPRVDSSTPKDFATELFALWGIGKQNDNGLLVLLVWDQKRLEMETGYGLESVLTDGWLKSMQMREMIPSFKEGRFGEGLLTGVTLSIEKLRAKPDTVVWTDVEKKRTIIDTIWSSGDNLVPIMVGVVFLFVLFTAIFRRFFKWLRGWFLLYRHRKVRACDSCGKTMQIVPMGFEEMNLSPGERKEHELDSVTWLACKCACGEVRSVPDHRPPRLRLCHKCGFNTLTSSSKFENGTLSVIITKCHHCLDERTVNYVAPPAGFQTNSSSGSGSSSGSSFGSSSGSSFGSSTGSSAGSSSGSSSEPPKSGGGGSDFGGGSSGGGGAGSSW